MTLALPLSTSNAQPSGAPGDATAHKASKILEVNVTGDPDRLQGQPVVAVNPKNDKNLVYVSTDDIVDGATLKELKCYVAYSRDGGSTWKRVAWPYGNSPQCGDPYLAVDSEGVFYLSFNKLGCPDNPSGPPNGTCNGVPNRIGVARSTDGGRTWSDPVDSAVDRGTTPRLRVDMATNDVYVVGGGVYPGPATITVSKDQGRTWSPAAALPSQPFGDQIAVQDHVLATATGMKIVNGTSTVPTEVLFQVSRDEGKSFVSSPVTDSSGTPVAPAEGALVPSAALATTDPIPWISADPTRSGRFAVMVPRGDNVEVYVTKDTGRSWTGPAVIAAPHAAKPWIDYGSNGVLGVMWRSVTDGNVDAYSAVSFDHGKSFSRPLKVNRTSHPYTFTGSGGDEWSRITVRGRYAYVSWSDARTGGAIDGIVSRVPLSLYR
ncbi:sialidase family protein [Streptomyces sp. NPDC056656]|uniref:sialidase family protein n=1 Tax=Streptomyces sp. NPDC056656 TaxID=3345895 RepID=UPI0036CC6C94